MFQRDPTRQVARLDDSKFLMVTQTNHSTLADHKNCISHDAVRRYLLRED